jgi:hypothetical protein
MSPLLSNKQAATIYGAVFTCRPRYWRDKGNTIVRQCFAQPLTADEIENEPYDFDPFPHKDQPNEPV